MAKTLHLDFETASSADLKKVGVENYVRSRDFEVTVIGAAFDDDAPVSLSHVGMTLPPEIRAHLNTGGIVRAWNASFEWHVLAYHYNLDVELWQMDCVMQRAMAWGLPASLQAAGEAMGLSMVKDKAARALMLKMSKPDKSGAFWHRAGTPQSTSMLNDLAAYCRRDVLAERALDRVVPMLTPEEKELSLVDACVNQKGVLVDRDAVKALYAAAQTERMGYDNECAKLTQGAVTSPGTEGAKLMGWLATFGVILPDLTKETVADTLLHGNIDPASRRVLELRQLSAKSSVSKLERMMDVASAHDGRARSLFQYYGAGRTGRWAGRLIQVQNLPRPDEVDAERVIQVAKAGAAGLSMFHPSPMRAISKSLRGCLVARPGHTLVAIDLSQIEARITAWLAGQEDMLEAFRRVDAMRGDDPRRKTEDVYSLQAKKVGSKERQLGKVLTLACGFGMGPEKFRDTAESQYGLFMTPLEAVAAVGAWRLANIRITRLWDDTRNAVLAAIRYGGLETVGRIRMKKIGGHLYIRKPGGGKLVYHNARINDGRDIAFDGVDPKTHQWGPQRTYGGKLVENVVQATARDVMALGMATAHKDGFTPVLHLHDEIVWEVDYGGNTEMVANMLKGMMLSGAGWTSGLPLAAEIKISRRFGK